METNVCNFIFTMKEESNKFSILTGVLSTIKLPFYCP